MNSMGTHLQFHSNEHNGTAVISSMQDNESEQNGLHINRESIYKGKISEELQKSQQHEVKTPLATQNNYPKLSSNFEKPVPTNHKNKQTSKQPQSSDNTKNNPKNNPFPNLKKDLVPEPAPYTVIQTFATRLRMNQAKNEVPIELSKSKITTKQGLPVVIFKKDDYMVTLAARCRYTLVGKFSNTMPKIELIRRNFILQTQLSGGVKIAHFIAS